VEEDELKERSNKVTFDDRDRRSWPCGPGRSPFPGAVIIVQPGGLREQKPWYVQPWVWLLIALPATAVIGSMISLYLAITTSDGLVVDDYYTRGKAINRDLARDQAAQAHRLEARFDIDMAGNRVALALQSRLCPPRRRRLVSSHAAGRDQRVALERVGEGQYAGGIGELGRGGVVCPAGADDWRLSGRMQIPLAAPVVLSPRYTDDH
jgi:hypothetical protein